MPLYRISDNGKVKKVTDVPFPEKYEAWRRALGEEAYQAIMGEFNRLINKRLAEKDPGNQIHTAGWIPGSDWTGTVWAPIYDKATKQDHVESAMCFGLMCFVAFKERPETWYVGKFKLDGRAINSNTYFMGAQ